MAAPDKPSTVTLAAHARRGLIIIASPALCNFQKNLLLPGRSEFIYCILIGQLLIAKVIVQTS